jgi:hypothetical protein
MEIILHTEPQSYRLLIAYNPGEPDEPWGRDGATPGEPPSWEILEACGATPGHWLEGKPCGAAHTRILQERYREQIERLIRRELAA